MMGITNFYQEKHTLLNSFDDVDYVCGSDVGYCFEVEFHTGAWSHRLNTKFCSVYQPPENYDGYRGCIQKSLYITNGQ